MELGSVRKIYCNTCNTYAHHELKSLHTKSSDSDMMDEAEEKQSQYYFLICRGCDTATLQEENITRPEGVDEIREIIYYPERKKMTLPLKIFRQLDPKLNRIYQEVITAFNHSAFTLSSVGLRTLLEGICAEKGIEGKTLYNKIEGLKAYLPVNIVESLHKFRFMGNEAAHELHAPSENELRLAIDVMEDLLNFLYELDYKARILFEGDFSDPSTITPSKKIIQQIVERQPLIPKGQKQLFQVLYQAGSGGLEINDIAQKTGRPKSELYGVLGALGRRINNTSGVQGKPGITYVFKFARFEFGDGWGWAMRPELRQVLKEGNYEWVKDWAK